jgi:hypothetical protein
MILAATGTTIATPLASFAQDTSPGTQGPSVNDALVSATGTLIKKMAKVQGRVAVLDFPSLEGVQTGLSLHIANKILNGLIEGGRAVVDRATLERVLNEQKLQQNALVDQTTAAKVGKLAGAGVIILGNYTKIADSLTVTLRALAVENGQFVGVQESEITLTGKNENFVNELLKRKVSQSQVSLEGGASIGSETESGEANGKPSIDKEEREFNKVVCNWVRPRADVCKLIYDLAHQYNFEERKLKSIFGITLTRAVTDDLHRDGMQLCSVNRSWTLCYAPDYTATLDVDMAISRGKNCWNVPSEGMYLKAWLHSDKSEVPGWNACLPKEDGVWNLQRATPKDFGKVAPKKRK